jgi:hypothetical protein
LLGQQPDEEEEPEQLGLPQQPPVRHQPLPMATPISTMTTMMSASASQAHAHLPSQFIVPTKARSANGVCSLISPACRLPTSRPVNRQVAGPKLPAHLEHVPTPDAVEPARHHPSAPHTRAGSRTGSPFPRAAARKTSGRLADKEGKGRGRGRSRSGVHLRPLDRRLRGWASPDRTPQRLPAAGRFARRRYR